MTKVNFEAYLKKFIYHTLNSQSQIKKLVFIITVLHWR